MKTLDDRRIDLTHGLYFAGVLVGTFALREPLFMAFPITAILLNYKRSRSTDYQIGSGLYNNLVIERIANYEMFLTDRILEKKGFTPLLMGVDGRYPIAMHPLRYCYESEPFIFAIIDDAILQISPVASGVINLLRGRYEEDIDDGNS